MVLEKIQHQTIMNVITLYAIELLHNFKRGISNPHVRSLLLQKPHRRGEMHLEIKFFCQRVSLTRLNVLMKVVKNNVTKIITHS
ncbi:MAG: hypothetical protein HNEKOMLI_00728 [Sodalis sp. Psp]|nr:hypothetical protein [Sodalis sp. Psp]MCR3757295.1 hypothetical protein [Sodalis sp. Ppy]